MITEVVTFALPQFMTREELVENYRQSARVAPRIPISSARATLSTTLAARRWDDEAWLKRVVELYGAEPTIRDFETPIVVDNLAQATVEV